MQAYEQGLKAGDTRLVISPDSEFFRYFSNPDGRGRHRPRLGRGGAQAVDAGRPAGDGGGAHTPCAGGPAREAMSDLVVAVGLVLVIEELLGAGAALRRAAPGGRGGHAGARAAARGLDCGGSRRRARVARPRLRPWSLTAGPALPNSAAGGTGRLSSDSQ